MRILVAVFIWIIFAGGLALYMDSRNPPPFPAEHTAESSAEHTAASDSKPAFASENTGHSVLEITPAFAPEPDPFALQPEPGVPRPALLVRMGNREILRVTEPMEPGIPLKINLPADPVPGKKEIWLEASPPLEAYRKTHALRIRVLENDAVTAEQTFWSEPGANVSGVLSFETAPHLQKESYDPS
ncbi:MAG: hypothetical protein R2941_22810 [Desulfobacterales bacterium]